MLLEHFPNENQANDSVKAVLYKLPVLICACNDFGKFIFWNEVCEQLSGYSAQEIFLHPNPFNLLYPSSKHLRSLSEIQQLNPDEDTPPPLQIRDGTQKIIRWSAFSGYLPQQTTEHWFLGVDITMKIFNREIIALQTEILEKLARKHALTDIFNCLTEHINALLPGNLSTVMLVSEKGDFLEPVQSPQMSEELIQILHNFPIGPNEASCGSSAYWGTRVISEDTQSDPRWRKYKEQALHFGFKACWSEPIRSETGQILGTFAIYLLNQSRSPSLLEISLLEKIVWIASLVIQTKQSEEKLNESEERFRTIFEKSLNPIFIADDAGYYLAVNQAAADLMGFSMEEMQGMHVSRIQTLTNDSAYQAYQKYTKKGQEVSEFTFQRPDGKIKTAQYQAIRIRKDMNLSILSDITDRIEMEQALQESKELFETFMDHLPGVVFILDAEFRSIFVNKKMRDLHLGVDLLGTRSSDIYPPEIATWMDAQNREVILKGYQVVKEEIQEPNGNTFLYETHKFPILRKGDPPLLGGFALNITDRVKAEKELETYRENLERLVKERTLELEATNKDLEAFVYSISHDLRAPLRHIDGFSQMIIQTLENPPAKVSRYLDKVREAIKKMSVMIDDLLHFSRLGRTTLQKEFVDINQLIAEVIESFKPDTEYRDIQWRIGQLPRVEGDYGLLRMVFENLISNAIKFSAYKHPAIIEIDICSNQINPCTLYIRDNGVGFDMAYADKLFQVFQRLHTHDEFEGTGIGLANVSRIIKKHGGVIWAQSEPQKGATFYISL